MKSVQPSKPIVSEDQRLKGLVKIMFTACIVLMLAFGAYYVFDRYVHVGDQSPVEMNINHLEKIVQENPSDPGARLSLAQYYVENKKYAEGIDQAEAVLTAYPENEGALFILGIAYTKSGQTQAAIDPLERFVSIRQANEDALKDMLLEAALFFLGQNYLTLNQTDQAFKVLTSALHIDPTDADVMYLLGTVYARTEQDDLAIEMYENAVKFVPDFKEVYHDMQVSFTALGKSEFALYAQGMEAFSTGDYILARQLLEKAAPDLPNYTPLALGLALTYEQLSETDLAVAKAQHALELDPHNFAANNLMARLAKTSQ